MSKLLKRLAAVGLIVAASIGTHSAHAVSAQTTIEIDFPTILILYHFDTISLSVSEASMATALGGLTSTSCSGAALGEFCVEVAGPSLTLDIGSPTADAVMNTSAPALPGALSSVAVDISNAWGVRSIGAFGTGLTADVAGPASNELDDGNSNVIPLSSVGTNDTNPPPGLTLATGDIIFTMDLSGLDVSGTYSGDFTITVTSP